MIKLGEGEGLDQPWVSSPQPISPWVMKRLITTSVWAPKRIQGCKSGWPWPRQRRCESARCQEAPSPDHGIVPDPRDETTHVRTVGADTLSSEKVRTAVVPSGA